VVIDRIKDLAETARGERFSPQYIENKLKFSPYIAETVVLGAGATRSRDDLHPLLDHLEMGGEETYLVHHLHRPRLAARSVRLAAQGGRKRQCHAAAGAAHFQIPALYKELDADDGELTRTERCAAASSTKVRNHHRPRSIAASATFRSIP